MVPSNVVDVSMKHPSSSGSRDESIYNRIVDTIITHQLPPAARLPEEHLAEAFGVSRTTIRKVLQRLALERLVVLQRNYGAQVACPSVEEAHQVFAARRMVEMASIHDVIKNAGEQQIEMLRKIIYAEGEAIISHRHADAIRISATFHVETTAIGGNAVISDFVSQLAARSSLIIAVYGSDNSVGCDGSHHSELVELIAEKRVSEAVAWTDQHLRKIEASLDFEQPQEMSLDFTKIFRE